uniref:Uncharacterized protein n=1 Tax=Arundo donax TaxID=35708 RepID=A0A0A9DKL6_ARUDO
MYLEISLNSLASNKNFPLSFSHEHSALDLTSRRTPPKSTITLFRLVAYCSTNCWIMFMDSCRSSKTNFSFSARLLILKQISLHLNLRPRILKKADVLYLDVVSVFHISNNLHSCIFLCFSRIAKPFTTEVFLERRSHRLAWDFFSI